MDRQCCPVETPRGNPPGGFHLKMVETPHYIAILTLGQQVGGFHLAEVETPHLCCEMTTQWAKDQKISNNC